MMLLCCVITEAVHLSMFLFNRDEQGILISRSDIVTHIYNIVSELYKCLNVFYNKRLFSLCVRLNE